MLFGFANAGVLMNSVGLATGLITTGLLIGKPLGIFLFGLFAIKVLKLELPNGMNLKHLFLVGLIAGIGFTVALFVAGVAFKPGENLDAAKMGALLSFLAAGLAVTAGKLMNIKKMN